MAPQEQDEQKVQYLRALFDTIPSPAFIVDADVRIRDFNTAAEQFLGEQPAAALHQRGGEAFHCLHSEPRGCGQNKPCRDCAIRNSVTRALAGTPACRLVHQAELRTDRGTVTLDLLVTASLLPYADSPTALLILEDVSHLVKRRRPTKRSNPSRPTPSPDLF